MTRSTRSAASIGGAVAGAIAWLCLVLEGCGSGGPPHYELSGEVTYDGDPVPAGIIEFEPEGMKVNKTTMGAARIQQGRYKTLPDKGVVGGPHVVTIIGYNGIPESGSGPMGATVFRPYTVKLELPERPSTHDFHIPGTAPGMVPR